MVQIGVIGAGLLGGTLARRLAGVGHAVQVANSRAPESLSDFTGSGITAGWFADVVSTSSILFLALPYSALRDVAADVGDTAGNDTIIVDTGNYYPGRDGSIPELDGDSAGPDTLWLSGLLRRPIFKAFNNITYVQLADSGQPHGSPRRIGLPVAGQPGTAKQRLLDLVNELGFDPVDGGELADSWRQQPGSPIYATDLGAEAIRGFLSSVDPEAPAIYRRKREEFDAVTAAGYQTILTLRAQGLNFDEIRDAMATQTRDAVQEVHKAQNK